MSFNKKLILNEGYAPNGTYFTSIEISIPQ